MKLRQVMTCLVFLMLCKSSFSQEYFNYANACGYAESILKIRGQIGQAMENVPGLRTTIPDTSQSLLYVDLLNASGESIRLVMLRKNLYVVGYVTSGIFYRFNDLEFSSIVVPGTIPSLLRMSSTYSSMERIAARNRESINVGFMEFSNAIGNLYRYGNGGVSLQQVAREMLVLVTAIPEAVRFSAVSGAIVSNYENPGWVLGRGLAQLTQNWGVISRYAWNINAMAASNSRFYTNGATGLTRDRLYGTLAVALGCPTDQSPVLSKILPEKYCRNAGDIFKIGDNYMSSDYFLSVISLIL